jgi:hypothetical protein
MLKKSNYLLGFFTNTEMWQISKSPISEHVTTSYT